MRRMAAPPPVQPGMAREENNLAHLAHAHHGYTVAYADQDVHTQWARGALKGLAEDDVREARRRQIARNTPILEVLAQFCRDPNDELMLKGWHSIQRPLHARDITERISGVPRCAFTSMYQRHDEHGQPVLALQVTFPREALLPAAEAFAPYKKGLTYAPPALFAPEGQEFARFTYRIVTVSTLTHKYRWAIARTHRLSQMLMQFAMSEILKVPVRNVSITMTQRQHTTGSESPYEMYCVAKITTYGDEPMICPICGSSAPLLRQHMDQDSHRLGMMMLMDGMALVEDSPEFIHMPFTTFERIQESQLGQVRIHQAAATNTDANVHTADGCTMHHRRLQGIHDSLVELHPDDMCNQVRSRARIKLMYFALLRLLDSTKQQAAFDIDAWQRQKTSQRNDPRCQTHSEDTSPAAMISRSASQVDKPSLSQVELFVMAYMHKAADTLLRMAVLRQQQILRAITLTQEEACASRHRIRGYVEDLRSFGGQLYGRFHRDVDALAEMENELLVLRARYSTPHPSARP